MVNPKLIRDILKTYELSEKLEERLFRMAYTNIEERHITSFDNIYRYIAHLIEKFNIPYNEQHALRLDSTLNGRPFSEIIGAEDRSLQTIIEDDNQITLTPVMLQHLLKNFGGNVQSFIHELLMLNNNELELDSNTFFNSIKYLEGKLNSLLKKFDDIRGMNILKLRPIIDIRFNPFHIQFGRRKYNGDPLTYFEEHQQFYSGMTRIQLSRFDSGLYSTLLRHNQLKKAIPSVENRLSETEIKQILDSHERAKGIPFRAEKITDFNHRTIKRCWEGNGLEVLSLNKNHEEIIIAHKSYNGSASRASKFIECSIGTILEHWRKEGLPIRKQSHQHDMKYDYSYHEPLKEERRREILPLYEKFNGNAKRASDNSQYNYNTIRNYWIKAGLIPKGHKEQRPFREIGPRLSQQEIQKIIDTFKENRGNVSKTARDTKFSRPTIEKYCKKAGLSITRGGNKKREDWEDDPRAYFLEHMFFDGLSRTELRHANNKLYTKLDSMGLLDELVPSKSLSYRGYESPLTYYQEHTELHGLSRGQLAIKDNALYVSLLRWDQMSEAIPNKLPTYPRPITPKQITL